MTDEEFYKRKHQITDAWVDVYSDSEICLDGRFTLKELMQILGLYAEYLSDKE